MRDSEPYSDNFLKDLVKDIKSKGIHTHRYDGGEIYHISGEDIGKIIDYISDVSQKLQEARDKLAGDLDNETLIPQHYPACETVYKKALADENLLEEVGIYLSAKEKYFFRMRLILLDQILEITQDRNGQNKSGKAQRGATP